MTKGVKRAVGAGVILVGIVLLGPTVAVFQTHQPAPRTALDDVLTGVAYACDNTQCTINIETGKYFCTSSPGSGANCDVMQGGHSCQEINC